MSLELCGLFADKWGQKGKAHDVPKRLAVGLGLGARNFRPRQHSKKCGRMQMQL
jgi:hypothetical protein